MSQKDIAWLIKRERKNSEAKQRLFFVAREVLWALEAYAEDWNSKRPTDPTVLIPKLRRAVEEVTENP